MTTFIDPRYVMLYYGGLNALYSIVPQAATVEQYLVYLYDDTCHHLLLVFTRSVGEMV